MSFKKLLSSSLFVVAAVQAEAPKCKEPHVSKNYKAPVNHKNNQIIQAPLKRSISLDTGYLPSLNSNRAIGEFDLELRQAWGAVYDWQQKVWKPTTTFGRGMLYALFNVASWGPMMAQMATYHELGHATRLRSMGIDASFINAGKAVWNLYDKGLDNIQVEDILSDDYFSTLLGVSTISALTGVGWLFSAVFPRYDKELLFTPKNMSEFYSADELKRLKEALKKRLHKKWDPEKDKDIIDLGDVQDKTFTPKAGLLFAAGGLNIQQDQCRRVENHLWYNGGDHFSTVGTYFWDKIWAGFQSGSSLSIHNKNSQTIDDLDIQGDALYKDGQDTSKICNAYRKMGIKLSHEEIVNYSLLSYVLSSQSYANIYQIYQTITEGENRVYAPEFWNIKLPNTALYFTTEGPTYNISSGYKVNDSLFIPVSIEIGLKKSIWEMNVGVRKLFPDFHDSFIHAEVVFNSNAIGGSVYGGAVFSKLWNVQAGLIYHNSKTLQGERNITSYEHGDSAVEGWLKVGVTY